MKYTFVVKGRISMHIDIEADSLESAIAKAQEAPVQSLCHSCAKGNDDEWSTSGELDCEPHTSELVEVYADEEEVDLETAKGAW